MTPVEILAKFRRLGVKIWLDGERLRYSAEKGLLTPELSAELAANKGPIVQFLRSARSHDKHTSPPLAPVARDGDLPLSFAQQRLWFLDQLEPNSPVYNIPHAVQLNGPLDLSALERSVNRLIQRQESLRTCFPTNDGQPAQLIRSPEPFTLKVEDLASMRDELRGAELRRLLDDEARRPFDLAAGPLFRLRLFRLSEEEHVLAVTMHHIISDGWSMGVATRELGALYTADVAGQPSPLPELSLQYADYAAWQREWLQGEVLEEQLAYWRRRLAGAPSVLELPTDKPRPPRQSHRGSRVSMQLDAGTTTLLKALSRRHNTTLFITLLTGFQALLSRWSGETDIVVGTVVAGRNKAETEGLIGFFVNTLAMRTDLSGDPAIAELLTRTTEVCLGAFGHQDVPFEKLIEELGIDRDMSRTPLVQVVLVLQNTGDESLEMPGLRMSEVVRGRGAGLTGTAKFDLQVTLNEGAGGIQGTLDYNLDLFEQETVRRMARQLERVLRAVAENENCRVSELPLMSEDEQKRLVDGWNKKTQEFACAESLVESFERAARQNPDAVAVTFAGEEVSYRELGRRSNQLAHQLRYLGVRTETSVGLFLERSVEMVVAILATLKAGAAYVPLEVSLPSERIAFMLEDAGCTHVLTETRLASELPSSLAHVVMLDNEVSDRSDGPLHVPIDAQNAAYVIYTSGSTGKPKGVVVTHGNVMRLMAATEDWFNFSSADTWTLFHSYAFDFSVWELWGPLLYGGRLVVVPYWVSRSPEEFYGLLLRENVTVLNQTPSAFRQLIKAEEQFASEAKTDSLSVRTVVFGGEALEPSSLRPWYERHGDEHPRLVNMYGITETTVHVTHRPLTRTDAEGARGSVIGWPIPDLRLYVLDGGMRPVPSGVAGELYVGGAGLARGYLNRPELTAERFPPDPLSAETGARLYRTGDVVRFGAAGELEYLRRADQQVKVRGFRIEPGEVEAALLSHEAVREAVVIARDEGSGHRLVAYVVGAPGVAVPSATTLREHVRRVLPEYLVPAVFVALESLPLTANGKVDRRALPAPQRDVSTAEYVAPRTEAERTLAAVWEEVLGAGHAGVEDNFFDLGGDSIRSVRVVALAKKRGLNFTVEQLFRHQTIAALVRQLNDNSTDENAAAATNDGPFSLISRADRERMPAGVEDAYPLSMLQAGMLFHGDVSGESALYHNYTSLHLRAPFDAHALKSAVRRLIEHHPILRTSFDLTSYSVPLQLVHRSVELPLQVEDLREMSDTEQETAIARWQDDERRRRIDWSQAPLVRFHVHLRGEDSFQFSFAEHHAILDGWSVATMLAELFRSYSSLSSGVAEPDQPPPSSLYRDFVALEQKALMSPDAEQFWRQWLYGSSVITVPRLQTQRAPEEPAPTHIINLPVTPELSDALKRTARETGIPIKSVLLAAHLRVLSQLGGQEDVVTGMVSHGRPEAADAERALGLYLNTLPFRLRLRGGTWTDLARAAFAAEVDAMPFRYYPMAQVKIDQGGRALFETCFNFTHFHVLDGVQRSKEIDLLDEQAFVRTEFVLTADFSLKGSGARVHLTLIGDGEVLSREHLESIGGYYAAALTALADEPLERYELKSLLSDNERERLLVEWNDTAAEYQRELCIHQVFEQEVQLRPDTVAVESVDQQLSYAELNRRADALAVALRRRGVGPDVLVAVMLERSVELIVALLAVNKAGGAYVPLNLSDPPARLRFIVEDAAARVLLTSTKFAKEITRETLAVDVICVDSDEHANDDSSVEPLAAAPDNLAYMLYTSGSTGKPKGVSVTHSGVLSLVRSNNYIDYGPDEVTLEFSPVSFDASTYEIWGALLNGGRLVIFPPIVPSVRELGEFIVKTQITSFLLTPALFHQFIDVNAGALGAVRQMLSGGDVLSAAPLDRAGALLEGRKVINVYGPTETTVMCCAYVVPRERPAGSIPIGSPIPNTQIYVVNGSQPSGVGERGEIYIGGVGLARGYHNRPDLTAERFVPDPFGKQHGGRLYRTGDAGRHLPEGVIQFIGRLDEQVKISGFRIEPGEIEAALETHPSVATAVAMVDEETPHDKRLIAYVVAKEDAPSTSVDELRAYLKERVPEYMTPSAFVMLDTLPLTPHGKLDKAALPAPRTNTGRPAGEYVGPRNTIERQLVVIWEELFKTSPIGVRDNFFDLGGHSLLLMMLVGRIEERLGERVAMADLFNGPTIEHLAELIRQHGRPTLTSVIVPMQTNGTRPPLFGLHPGSEEVWCYSELVRRLGTDQPFYGVQARRLDMAGLVKHTELEAMASDYVEALCEFHPGGPYLLCGWSMGGVIAFEVARQLRARGEHVALLALIDSQAPTRTQSKPSWFTLLAILALDLGLANEKLVLLLQEIRTLPPPGQLRRVWAETRRAGVIPVEMTLLEFRRLFDTFKASSEMMHRYEAGKYAGRVTLIRAEQSLEQDPAFVRFDDWNETEATDSSHDWTRLAAEGVDVHVVPGNHFSIMREPFVEALAERLRGCIDETFNTRGEDPPRAFAHVHQVV